MLLPAFPKLGIQFLTGTPREKSMVILGGEGLALAVGFPFKVGIQDGVGGQGDLCCNRLDVGISTIAEVRRCKRISFRNAIRGRRQINFVVGETPEADLDRAAENSIL